MAVLYDLVPILKRVAFVSTKAQERTHWEVWSLSGCDTNDSVKHHGSMFCLRRAIVFCGFSSWFCNCFVDLLLAAFLAFPCFSMTSPAFLLSFLLIAGFCPCSRFCSFCFSVFVLLFLASLCCCSFCSCSLCAWFVLAGVFSFTFLFLVFLWHIDSLS